MPYVIVPKPDAIVAHAWSEQQELEAEKRLLALTHLYRADGSQIDCDCEYPNYSTYGNWLLSRYSPAYDDRATAAKVFDAKYERIEFVATPEQEAAWRSREQSRFDDGTYTRVPWSERDHYREHYAHISVEKPDEIAFIRDSEQGVLNRKTRMKAGRYLQQYYSEFFSPEKIARYIGCCKAEFFTLKVTQDAKEIRDVYIHGPRSCMKAFKDWETHPCEVYAGPDLALAYYGSRECPSARAVVWPEYKVHSTIYGDSDTLTRLLEAAGYSGGSIDGARIRKILHRSSNSYLMPFVDGIDGAEVEREYIRLGDGPLVTNETEGTTYERHRSYCENCNDCYDADNEGGNGMCESCYNDSTCCHSCGETAIEPEGWSYINNSDYCPSCALRRFGVTCVSDGCSHRWIESERDDEERADRVERGVTAYCDSCSIGKKHCSDCDALVDVEHIHNAVEIVSDVRENISEDHYSADVGLSLETVDHSIHSGYKPYCDCDSCLPLRTNSDYRVDQLVKDDGIPYATPLIDASVGDDIYTLNHDALMSAAVERGIL